MKALNDYEIKKIEVDILKYIKSQCDENELKYFIGYGTLLGAVRHHGFIPWDDDIDIWMPRDDYKKLLSINRKMVNCKFKMLSCEYTKGYNFPFAKMCDTSTYIHVENFDNIQNYGVFVDIFALDGVPDNYRLIVLICRWITKIRTIISMKSEKMRFGKILKLMFSPVGARGLARIQSSLAQLYKYDLYDKVGSIEVGDRDIFDKEVFQDTISLEFEGEYFDAPKDYEKCLTVLYGDYMELPPEEKRVSLHNFKVYKK